MSTPLATPARFKNKLYLKTFGCQMNEYDSSRMFDLLKQRFGVEKVEEAEQADIILVNTCSVREKAQEKLFDCLGRYRPLKIKNPNLVIGVGGCVASQEGKGIIQRAPYVDLVFGPQTIHKLADMIDEVRASETRQKRVVDTSFPEIEKFDNLPEPRAEGVKAYVSIMEGCSKYCSFCIVPYTRGEEFSRPFDDVLAECSELAAQGVREITLLGQNVNHYLGTMHDGKIADLALLIHYLSAMDGIGRIRFTTSHPVEFSDTLIDAYAKVPKLANHLHLPVQSGSDRILTLMKRNHTALEFKSKMRRLRAVRPDITISTDIIVGFPGETDEDFEKTMNLVADVGFDQSFSFIYSARPGTPAADLPDDVSMEVKKQRLHILQDRLKSNGVQISRRMVGTVQRVLVDGVSKKSDVYVSGRTENNRIVNFKGSQDLIGQFVDVEITDVNTNSLQAVLVAPAT
jgi:tRNA-2-methylthio-N6-dimethylallyladenosine synthase